MGQVEIHLLEVATHAVPVLQVKDVTFQGMCRKPEVLIQAEHLLQATPATQ